MWRKGGRLLAKLACLGLVLSVFHFRKLPTTSENERKDMSRVQEQGEQFPHHAYPGADDRIAKYDVHAGYGRHLLSQPSNCTPRAVEQFPWDWLTPEQRQNGVIVVHILIALYMFVGLSIVCDRYFVPSLEILCELLHIETDIAGATFMAAGSSAPELATAIIGVFVAKADVGLGTVVGSAIYNVMFVISACALFATTAVKLHWWPMVRDCLVYLLSVLALILVIHDAVVQWYEALILVLMYVLYVVLMFFNGRLEVTLVPHVNYWCRCNAPQTLSETTMLTEKTAEHKTGDSEDGTEHTESLPHAQQEAETWHKLCERPEGAGWTCLWLMAMPLSIVLFVTVPDCRRPGLRRWFWLTFLMSLVWLSAFCFLMVWMITVIGFTANIPDSVMSLTFIAFGVSLPDVVASVLVVRDGLGDMAVSNAIGSNVFDILVCLGLPWLLETSFKDPGSEIPVYSEGLVYSSVMLLSTVAFLLIATHLNGWRLTKTYGIVLLVVYVIYTLLASLYELNVFGYFHPPECPSSY